MQNQLRWKCPACKIVVGVPKDHNSIHCACGFVQYNNPPGLGDRVAATLAKMGLTEKRYKAAKQAIGLSHNCNCKKRQQRLNAMSKAQRKPE